MYDFRISKGNVTVYKITGTSYIGVDIAPHGHLVIEDVGIGDKLDVEDFIEAIRATDLLMD